MAICRELRDRLSGELGEITAPPYSYIPITVYTHTQSYTHFPRRSIAREGHNLNKGEAFLAGAVRQARRAGRIVVSAGAPMKQIILEGRQGSSCKAHNVIFFHTAINVCYP